MTVVVWDGTTLAADRRCRHIDFIYKVSKLSRVNGCLVGIAGNAASAGAFLKWFSDGADPSDYPIAKDSNFPWALVVRPSGVVERYENTGFPIVVEEKQHAVGSGYAFAMAAMHLGRDAAGAVEVASHFDASCGNGVDTLTFEPNA
jgi:ATP-dependent protease HslVU (ClpYQ) peptidase subunit